MPGVLQGNTHILRHQSEVWLRFKGDRGVSMFRSSDRAARTRFLAPTAQTGVPALVRPTPGVGGGGLTSLTNHPLVLISQPVRFTLASWASNTKIQNPSG